METEFKEEFAAVCNKNPDKATWDDVDERGNAIKINEVVGAGEFYYRLIIYRDTAEYYIKKYCTGKIIKQAAITKEEYLELLDKILIK